MNLAGSKKSQTKDKKTNSKKPSDKKPRKTPQAEGGEDQKRPKRSWPAFFFFQKEIMPKLKQENKTLSQKELVSVSV